MCVHVCMSELNIVESSFMNILLWLGFPLKKFQNAHTTLACNTKTTRPSLEELMLYYLQFKG